MFLINSGKRWELSCSFEDRRLPREAGFNWDNNLKVWYTKDIEIARKFRMHTAKEYYKINKGLKSRRDLSKVIFVYYKMFFRSNKSATQIIMDAIVEVSNRCDGAVMDDCEGFNSYDVSRADDILSTGINSSGEAASAFMMVYKYRKQLSNSVLNRMNNIRKFALCLDL